jgi:hypothetical protein
MSRLREDQTAGMSRLREDQRLGLGAATGLRPFVVLSKGHEP